MKIDHSISVIMLIQFRMSQDSEGQSEMNVSESLLTTFEVSSIFLFGGLRGGIWSSPKPTTTTKLSSSQSQIADKSSIFM
jgi:hypothetical protein